MKYSFRRVTITFMLFTLLVTILFLGSSIAQENTQPADLGPIISPGIIALPDELGEFVEPGDVITRNFTVTHDYQEVNKRVEFFMITADFVSDGITNNPKWVTPSSDVALPRSSLKDWIKVKQDSITLNTKGQKAVVDFTINVPDNALGGTYYGGIILTNNRPVSGNNEIGLGSELALLLVVDVIGPGREARVTLDDFYLTDIDGNRNPLFGIFEYMPLDFNTKATNAGNTQVVPIGDIFVSPSSDPTELVGNLKINPPINNQYSRLIPGSRVYQSRWEGSFISIDKRNLEADANLFQRIFDTYYLRFDFTSPMIWGRYNALAKFSYRDLNNQSVTYDKQLSFTVFPWKAVLGILLVIAGIIGGIYYVRNKQAPKKAYSRR